VSDETEVRSGRRSPVLQAGTPRLRESRSGPRQQPDGDRRSGSWQGGSTLASSWLASAGGRLTCRSWCRPAALLPSSDALGPHRLVPYFTTLVADMSRTFEPTLTARRPGRRPGRRSSRCG
jgi:hypothetical protein